MGINIPLISPDGGTLYLCTTASSASGKTMTNVTAYSTADTSSPATIATWDSGLPRAQYVALAW